MVSGCNHLSKLSFVQRLHYPLKLASWVISAYVPGQTFAISNIFHEVYVTYTYPKPYTCINTMFFNAHSPM